jgi:ribosomal protein S18 acetylase RimI-like enzyme
MTKPELQQITINRYDTLSESQVSALGDLYNRSFDLVKTGLPVFRERLLINQRGTEYFLAEAGDRVEGCSVIREGAILLLLVDEEARGQGTGGRLLEASEGRIGEDYGEVSLGASEAYLLCGVPQDPRADFHRWFLKRGYVHRWTALDLTVDLGEYSPEERSPLTWKGVSFRKLGRGKSERRRVFAAAEKAERGWGRFFIQPGVNAEIAFKGDEPIGGLIIGESSLFTESLPGAGSLGCLWVAKEHRRRGIGAQLYRNALGELKAASYPSCHIGYTYEAAGRWYEKPGAVPDLCYWLGDKNLAAGSPETGSVAASPGPAQPSRRSLFWWRFLKK